MRSRTLFLVLATQVALAATGVPTVRAAEGAAELADLAKMSQNPVANLNSIPFQWNFYSGGGLGAQSMMVLNVQPVLPLPLNEDWLLVSRTIVPFVNIPGAGIDRFQGIADIQQQFFFSPQASGALVWGAGPILSLPTSNQAATQTGQYAAGPSLVVLKMGKKWVFGGLANHMWKVAGSDDVEAISLLFVQPFVNLNLPGGWAISTGPAITADWNAPSDQRWTVPLGAGFSKVTMVGGIPVSALMQYYGHAVRPDSAPAGLVRFSASLLFPRAQ